MKLLFCNSYEDDNNQASVRAEVPDGSKNVVFTFSINGKELKLSTIEAKILRSLMSKEPQ